MSLEVTIQPGLPLESRQLAQNTIPLIEEVVRPEFDPIRAEWEAVPDQPTELILKLRYDFVNGYREERFSVSELRSSEQFKTRLREVWWELLEESSRKSRRRIRELLETLDAE